MDRPQRLDTIFIFFRLRTFFFKKRGHQSFEHRTTQHGEREGEQEQVTMCYMDATVCFSSVIDRQSVSEVIVRALCDVCIKINSVTVVIDEQKYSLTVSYRSPGKLCLHLQMSSRTCMSKIRSCVAQDNRNHGRRLSSNDCRYYYL
jgi:hypothetical protein